MQEAECDRRYDQRGAPDRRPVHSQYIANIIADIFYAWVTQDLLPKLLPACVIVMDNATFHKRQDIKTALANAGHTLEYLPSYSPNFNDIEPKWAQAKAIRKLLESNPAYNSADF